MYIFLGIIFLWLLGLTFFLYRSISHYGKLIQGRRGENLAEILDKILKDINKTKTETEGLKRQLDKLEDKSVNFTQRVKVLRFNPFSNTGGDQSFILTILDEEDTGILLTSLHGRGVTRWYAKNVKKGKGIDYELSKEELKAIQHAK